MGVFVGAVAGEGWLDSLGGLFNGGPSSHTRTVVLSVGGGGRILQLYSSILDAPELACVSVCVFGACLGLGSKSIRFDRFG